MNKGQEIDSSINTEHDMYTRDDVTIYDLGASI